MHSVSDTFLEQDKIWNEDIVELTKKQMFKMFDGYVEREFHKKDN